MSRGFRLLGADLRKLPPACRRRIAAYRVTPRKSLLDAPGAGQALAIVTPAVLLLGAVRLVVTGPGWRRLLAVPLAAAGLALVTGVVWYVQRPVPPRRPGFIRSRLERGDSAGK